MIIKLLKISLTKFYKTKKFFYSFIKLSTFENSQENLFNFFKLSRKLRYFLFFAFF